MTDKIGVGELARMIGAAAERIRANHAELSKLDSATGDGDHGTAMLKAAEAADKAADENAAAAPKDMLHAVGWGVMCIDGGSTGPLLGSLFMGMSEGAGDAAELDAEALATTFEAGLAKVQKQSKAQVGDKTMMDALMPAVQALRAASGDGFPAMLEAAAQAAAQGAEATKEMQARFGRARNLGERTLGHVDPGARSMAYLFEGFAEGL